jgi:hypothetical protein
MREQIPTQSGDGSFRVYRPCERNNRHPHASTLIPSNPNFDLVNTVVAYFFASKDVESGLGDRLKTDLGDYSGIKNCDACAGIEIRGEGTYDERWIDMRTDEYFYCRTTLSANRKRDFRHRDYSSGGGDSVGMPPVNVWRIFLSRTA